MLADYLGELNEDLIKDNFVIVYEVILCNLSDAKLQFLIPDIFQY